MRYFADSDGSGRRSAIGSISGSARMTVAYRPGATGKLFDKNYATILICCATDFRFHPAAPMVCQANRHMLAHHCGGGAMGLTVLSRAGVMVFSCRLA
jgi:hypothetical protein